MWYKKICVKTKFVFSEEKFKSESEKPQATQQKTIGTARIIRSCADSICFDFTVRMLNGDDKM